MLPFMIMGVLLALLGCLSYAGYTLKFKRLSVQGRETTGTIVDISGMRKHRRAMLSYEVNGDKIVIESPYYSNTMKVGDTLLMYVNEDDPTDLILCSNGPKRLSLLFIFIGITTLVLCLINSV